MSKLTRRERSAINKAKFRASRGGSAPARSSGGRAIPVNFWDAFHRETERLEKAEGTYQGGTAEYGRRKEEYLRKHGWTHDKFHKTLGREADQRERQSAQRAAESLASFRSKGGWSAADKALVREHGSDFYDYWDGVDEIMPSARVIKRLEQLAEADPQGFQRIAHGG